jgi:hypothetical protein
MDVIAEVVAPDAMDGWNRLGNCFQFRCCFAGHFDVSGNTLDVFGVCCSVDGSVVSWAAVGRIYGYGLADNGAGSFERVHKRLSAVVYAASARTL